MKYRLPIFDEAARPDAVSDATATDRADAAPNLPAAKPSWRSLDQAPLSAHSHGDHDDIPLLPFEAGAAQASDGISRREFMRLLGAGATLAGVSACVVREPPEDVLPYTHPPAAVTPGKPLHFATSMSLGGVASGLLVTSYEGRPTKVEGSPEHPTSLGATTPIAQAAILSLYDPHRARTLRHGKTPRTWSELQMFVSDLRESLAQNRGAGLRFLLEPSSSPLLADLRSRILADFPEAKFFAYAPAESNAAAEGAAIAFGKPLDVHHDFSRANLIVSIDDDFLGRPHGLSDVRQFAERRVPENMNRLYVLESNVTLTGMMADHRFRMTGRELRQAVLALFDAVATNGATAESLKPWPWLGAMVKDLLAHRGASAILAGPRLPANLHAVVQAINFRLGNVGKTITYTKPTQVLAETGVAPLSELVREMRSGKVNTLIITAYNPVYSAPADLDFRGALAKVPHAIYHAAYDDETAAACEWTVPASHALESWGDGRAADGTVTFAQPLIRPLFEGVSAEELLATVLQIADRGGRELLRQYWRANVPKVALGAGKEPFEWFWSRTVQRGFVEKSALPMESAKLDNKAILACVSREQSRLAGKPSGLELQFVPDAKVYDGRFANNAWLQELPEPVTKLTWDNAALISPKTATDLGLKDGDIVKIESAGRHVHAPIMRVPGHADGCVTLSLGYGRQGMAERVGRNVGVNAYLVRTSNAPWLAENITLSKTGQHHAFALTQEHGSMEGRPLALETTVAEFDPDHLEEQRGKLPSLYEPPQPKATKTGPYQWAMAIDLSKCTGCSSCVVACQSENNIPVVGKEGVAKSREMHWLRIDRYFSGNADDPGAITQPVACVHCEMAPCEYVCPVNATVHSEEGLNEMVYNRCVGTRYCSNNCPYKVRHFNFFNYTAEKAPIEKLGMNPQVTVRARGVMEKCTYCVQRIERVRIDARIAGREIEEKELQTACQQVCPSRAIDFGTLTNAESAVSKKHADPRRYDLLHELGTRPRTAYLVRIKNPNPEIG